MHYLTFLKTNARWLAAGALLTGASTFGQTYFIALFGLEIRQAYSLSHGDFGFVYMLATLASAIVFSWAGQLADHMSLKNLGLITLAGLSIACMLMGLSNSWIMLAVSLFAIRLCGQGMLGHIAMTAMARWFNAHRGRALGIASLGHAGGEAALPAIAVAVMAVFGWRQTWMITAVFIIIVIIPVFYSLTRQKRRHGTQETHNDNDDTTRHWTRRQVLRDSLFYAILPGTLAPAFILTVTFFHQAHLVELKGWSLGLWASFYPFFAGAATIMSLISGWAIDRWSARQLLPFYLLPMAASMLIFAWGHSPWSALVAMLAAGTTVGSSQTITSAMWAELYGTRYLGTVKSMTAAIMVLATAIGPGLTGMLMDNGIALSAILASMGYYSIAISAVFLLLMSRMMATRIAAD